MKHLFIAITIFVFFFGWMVPSPGGTVVPSDHTREMASGKDPLYNSILALDSYLDLKRTERGENGYIDTKHPEKAPKCKYQIEGGMLVSDTTSVILVIEGNCNGSGDTYLQAYKVFRNAGFLKNGKFAPHDIVFTVDSTMVGRVDDFHPPYNAIFNKDVGSVLVRNPEGMSATITLEPFKAIDGTLL